MNIKVLKSIYKVMFENFWVFPINERVEKGYLRYGFETVANITNVHAFLYGKSIKEIQGG